MWNIKRNDTLMLKSLAMKTLTRLSESHLNYLREGVIIFPVWSWDPGPGIHVQVDWHWPGHRTFILSLGRMMGMLADLVQESRTRTQDCSSVSGLLGGQVKRTKAQRC